jgi:4-aminobutyrate aminotransferase-like enzyme
MRWNKSKNDMVMVDGKKCIDFTSSIFCQNFGHNNPYVIKEVKKQMRRATHAYGYSTVIKELFTGAFTKLMNGEIAVDYTAGKTNYKLFSTGSEAIEAMIKIALNNGYTCAGIQGAMHGRTTGAEALVGKRVHHSIFSYPSIPEYSPTIKNTAFFIEGYRGYDCKQLTHDDYINLMQLQRNGNIIIMDEIQSGMYRTDGLFSFSNSGTLFVPDAIVVGKSIGGGFPLSCIYFSNELSLDGLELTSTHSGQPIQMASGYAVLEFIRTSIFRNNFDCIGNYSRNLDHMRVFFARLGAEGVEYNYKGMVGAIKTNDEEKFFNTCMKLGVLVTRTNKGWIKIAPPLTISLRNLQKGLGVIRYAAT